MMLETGWLKFGGTVPESFNNFGGIGATDDGGAPASFPDMRTGIRAVVQHLYAVLSVTIPTFPMIIFLSIIMSLQFRD